MLNQVPASGQYVSVGTVAAGATGTVSVTFTVPVGQVVAAGAYTDALRPTAYDPVTYSYWAAANQSVTATVLAVCNLPAPSAASLDFSAAIVGGVASPATVQTDSIANAQCTSPTRIQLTGNSLQTTPLGTVGAGFDNFINWTATVAMGSATATLTTTGLTATPAVTSTSKNTLTAGAFTSSMTISNVHLIAGNQLGGGVYSSNLTIQIDPSL